MAHNGWTNYETWAVKLWMDNDEVSYDSLKDQLRGELAATDLAQQLKDDHNAAFPLQRSDVYSDLLQNALDRVNWREIAEALLEDYNDQGDG